MQKAKEVNVNFKEGFRKLSEAEQKYDFFSAVYRGIPLWLYGRDRALNIVSGITSYKGQSISSQKIDLFNLIGRIFYFIANLHKIFGNDIIIFTNERHLEKDIDSGKYYNPFVETVLEANKDCRRPLIFEFPIPMTKKYKEIGYDRYLTIDILLSLRQLFSPFYILRYGKIKKEFEPKLRSSRLFKDSEIKEILKRCHRSAYSILCYGAFLKLIKLLNPKAKSIYSCMGGFDKFPGVIEIQPALIIDCQSVYIYPLTPQIKNYLKDKKMMVFSERVKDILAENGYLRANLSIIDNPKIKYYFLKNVKNNIPFKENIGNKIVIIGNWGGSLQKVMKKVIFDIENNKEKFKGWDISMVLHPTEKNTYKGLSLAKVRVFENHQVSLWGMLTEAVCTINITSSVLEESAYFGCFNIILKDEKFDDQLDFVKAMCGEYPFKAIVDPENFVGWFVNNNKMIEEHIYQKNQIIEKNYEYFLSNKI